MGFSNFYKTFKIKICECGNLTLRGSPESIISMVSQLMNCQDDWVAFNLTLTMIPSNNTENLGASPQLECWNHGFNKNGLMDY